MIDAPTNARRYRVTDRSVIVISSGPHGHPAGATGVHARRTAILPEAVRRRQRGSAMFAAKPHEAEQELPEGIPEPRNVNQRVAASGGNGRSGIRDYSDYPMLPIGLLAFQLRFGRTSALVWPQTWQVNCGSMSDNRTPSRPKCRRNDRQNLPVIWIGFAPGRAACTVPA
jgi:hypothetical protein